MGRNCDHSFRISVFSHCLRGQSLIFMMLISRLSIPMQILPEDVIEPCVHWNYRREYCLLDGYNIFIPPDYHVKDTPEAIGGRLLLNMET